MGRASDRPTRLSRGKDTVERVEGDDGSGDAGTSAARNLQQLQQSLNRLVSLDTSILEEWQIGAIGIPEAEQPSEGEVVLHCNKSIQYSIN